ncbi:hypothetical protein SAMN05428941_7727 [Streptomyces sp. 2114.2]|nr:hypothetical protein SAMN05428941_7727 [Streptomyces sp. 2114.2]
MEIGLIEPVCDLAPTAKCREACLRCPMLHVSPRRPTRLDELETDLLQR